MKNWNSFKKTEYDELVADLSRKLSIQEISKVKIGEVNLSRKTVKLMVFFKDKNDRNY